MEFPRNLKYTKSHEWARKEENKVTVGITEYAQKELSDVVFVELPAIGREVKQGQPCAVVESVKAAFDIYAPVSGTVSAVNKDLEGNPALINDDAYGLGWFFQVDLADAEEMNNLMDSDKYQTVVYEGKA